MLSTPAEQENPIGTRLTLCRSLRDCSWLLSLPRTSSWATLCRPYGTGSRSALSADLFCANAGHTCCSRKSNLDKIDSLPSLGDCSCCDRYPGLRPGLHSAVPTGLVGDLP